MYPWRASVLRLYYLGMTDPKQKELRGPYRSFLWKATATAATSTASGDADASRRTVGAIAFTITPSPEDTAAVAKIQEADALLPPVLPPPDGFNLGAFKDMIGACKAWNKAHIPSHSVLCKFTSKRPSLLSHPPWYLDCFGYWLHRCRLT